MGAHPCDERQDTDEFPCWTRGTAKIGAIPNGTDPWEIVLCVDIGNMKRAMLVDPAVLWLIDTDLDAAKGMGPK